MKVLKIVTDTIWDKKNRRYYTSAIISKNEHKLEELFKLIADTQRFVRDRGEVPYIIETIFKSFGVDGYKYSDSDCFILGEEEYENIHLYDVVVELENLKDKLDKILEE